MIDDPRFPDAPPTATISEEGWLLVRDEAWTSDEWNSWRAAGGARIGHLGRPRKYDDEKHAKDRERKRARAAA